MLKIGNYFREKTIKLSDSYRCMIYNNDTDAVDCIQCIGFTCPKILQYNEEVYKYGNLAQKFLIPKFDVVHEFTIDFFESFDTNAISITSDKINGTNSVATCLSVRNWLMTKFGNYGKGYHLEEYFDDQVGGTQYANYNLDEKAIDIPKVVIEVMDNNMQKKVLTYTFNKCKIAKIVPYEFDYQGEDLCKWTITFTFDSMTKG